jgi:transcriptional regulator with XRE-family HTH domain
VTTSLTRPSTSATRLGALLKEWRAARRLSQLDLALEADVSARHLSYVETGKAQPSREMVARLADALHMPLRERNALLLAAGYAPDYPETPLATSDMAQVRRAVELILEHQEPYPAFVLDRFWDIVATNRAAVRVGGVLRGGAAPVHANMVRQFFDPADLRPVVVNWEEIAGDLIRHLHDQVAAVPSDPRGRALLEDVLRYPGVPARWHARELAAAPSPLLTVHFRVGAQELRFFSTITTFATPSDVTLDELRIESVFPADEATAELCRRLARQDSLAAT